MVVHHQVNRERLRKRYFRRWLYWHGISRAVLFQHGGFDMEEPELENPPNAGDRQIGGVPVHLIRKAMRRFAAWVYHTTKCDITVAFEDELWLCFFAGVVRQRWIDRRLPVTPGPASPACEVYHASSVQRSTV